jgi:hypothetical protein
VIDDYQIFHMELSGLNFSHPHAWGIGIPFDVSAVVCNSMGHAVDAIGSYRIVERDLRNRHCILDLGYAIGRRIHMKWRVDKKAVEREYDWQAWP